MWQRHQVQACCLARLHVVARELRERNAFVEGLIVWLRDEHGHEIEAAGSDTTLFWIMRGSGGRA